MNPVLESSFNKNQWVLLLTVALVFGGVVLQVESPFVVHAQAEATDAGKSDSQATSGDDEKIEEAMGEMKSAGRSFRRALRGKKVDEALKQAHRAQKATLVSKDLVPDLVMEIEDLKVRAESLKEYRLMMIATMEQWLLIEKSLLAGDLQAAGELAGKISELKKSGHQKYRKEED